MTDLSSEFSGSPSSSLARAPTSGVLTALPFGLLVLAGSFLLFQIELIMARLLLPGFGSSASVWTTCLMFYQGALFAGYLYAARASVWIGRGGYRWAHVAFVVAPIVFFPFRIQTSELPPIAAILLSLTLSAGLPFLALSTTSVVAQAWFTNTRHPRRSDPYFLYGLSNAGALAALLSYPFLIEPALNLRTQLGLWYAGYIGYALINVWCVRVLQHDSASAPQAVAAADAAAAEQATAGRPRVSGSSRLQWLLLSAGANALLMVVTAVLSMDAPVPLIWILPLTLYLITLIICFAPRPASQGFIHALSFVGLAITVGFMVGLENGLRPELATIGLQSTILFVVCLLCHDRLIRSKPESPRDLGTFYLSISLGGWVGSVLVGLVTPIAFAGLASHSADYVMAGSLILAAFMAKDAPAWMASLRGHPVRIGVAATVAAMGMAMSVMVVTSSEMGAVYGSRTFYGLYRVEDAGGLRRLYHGSTVHGVESLNPAERGQPRAYYHGESPIGAYLTDSHGAPSVGIVGLGVGALAAYQQPDQIWDYYEIDPEVENIARAYFSFMKPADDHARVILGDARLSLQKTPNARYDVLVMDTFSSDFVPLHLITVEALSLYLSKLQPDGVLFFHISNRLFDLKPILTRIGSELGARTASLEGKMDPGVAEATGRFPSIWYAMTRDPARQGHLIDDLGWTDHTGGDGNGKAALWTDDYVNIFEAVK